MAKVKKIDPKINLIIDHIVDEALEDVMGSRFAEYAKDVLQDRAIPDVRDGLKPVQRRIVYAMYLSKMLNKKPRVKCATIVGEVMGKYHPHGDSSIYEALVRMGQDWTTRVPLIDFQGNNGSIDGDGPAAMRYTEARLSEIAEMLTLNIEKNTVDMKYTFDDARIEPIVLPSRFPNFLINGSSGIGVGMATEVPPHNFHEVLEATIYRINHPNCSLSKLREFIKGPDFPTGGSIFQGPGLESMYETGRGRVDISSKYEIIKTKDKHQIVISEIPYGNQKQKMVFEIDKLVHAKTIDGMLEVRDESHGPDIRIVIDLKSEAKSELIVNYLVKNKLLLGGFSANIVAIVEGRPKTLSLIEILDAYIAHQVNVITRQNEYDLLRAKARLHIVEGLILAINNIDEVVRIIRGSKSKAESKEKLMLRFKLSSDQSEAILMMPLYKLNNTDVFDFEQEAENLKGQISEHLKIINEKDYLNKVLVNDLKELNKKYHFPRLTLIEGELEIKSVDERELIAKEEVMLALSRDGYLKRSSLKSYLSSGENALPGLKVEDRLIYMGPVKTTDFLLAFTNLGNFIYLPIHLINEGKWKDEGKHLNYLVSMNAEEKIIKAFNISKFRDDLFIGLLSKKGQIKKSFVSDFQVSRYNKPINCMKLLGDDELVGAELLHGDDDLIIIASDGRATFFNENEVSPTGLKSSGIKAFSNLKQASLIGMYAYNKHERSKIILITDMGHLRIFEPHQLELTKRLGKTQDAMKSFKSDPHQLVYLQKVHLDEKTNTMKLKLLGQDKTIFDLEVNEFYLTPIDKYAKTNIPDFNKKDPFIGGYSYDNDFIGKSTKSEYTAPKEVIEEKPIPEKKEEKKSAQYEQLSIFDLMGD